MPGRSSSASPRRQERAAPGSRLAARRIRPAATPASGPRFGSGGGTGRTGSKRGSGPRARMMRARGIQSVSSPSIRCPTTSKGLKVSAPSLPRAHGSGIRRAAPERGRRAAEQVGGGFQLESHRVSPLHNELEARAELAAPVQARASSPSFVTMRDQHRPKQELIDEVAALRKQVADLKAETVVRRRVEDALRLSEEQLRALADSAPAGLCIIRPGGTVRAANLPFARLLGYESAAELQRLGEVLGIFAGPEELERVLADGAAGRPADERGAVPPKGREPAVVQRHRCRVLRPRRASRSRCSSGSRSRGARRRSPGPREGSREFEGDRPTPAPSHALLLPLYPERAGRRRPRRAADPPGRSRANARCPRRWSRGPGWGRCRPRGWNGRH